MNNKSLYLGGGLKDHQILYMIPIIIGTCKKNKIKKIIFEKKLSKKILKLKIIREILKKYEIAFEDDLYYTDSIIIRIPRLFLYTFLFFFKSFLNKQSLLNKKDSWFNSQIKHCLWDTGIRNNNKELDRIELRSRIKSSRLIALQYLKTKKLIKNNVNIAFVQHVVYQYRASFALLRQNAKVIVQNKSVLVLQSKNRDYGFKYLDKKIFNKSKNIISNYEIKKYWKMFLKGKSEYLEARNASNIKDRNKNIGKNVIMLHIFRDSPFTNIDRSRIFPDYYSWIVETLKIIRHSKERWVIRRHPSAKRWGENQDEIIRGIFKKIFKDKTPKNIIYERDKNSNISQLKNSKRIVTFAGNSHLEAACFGIKPIIISNTTLSDYDKKFYYQPKSLKNYESLLLEDSGSKKFELSKDEINYCQRIIYLIQCCVNFGNDVGSHHVFKSDPKSIFHELFKKVKLRLYKNLSYSYYLGLVIGIKTSQSINKKYIKHFVS